ncbi:phenazine antibiotic biosynthesis protein [Tsukamurella ocularis]|uniref:phenazine antibiotic biosynthesis protein n=1 Tax=Tsukamurella ocularis TaxID=1970234 RepID=UPI0021671D06|nr:phenazine antibiotic biosynthesis protein [Tsukamurella ocularis]MCS3779339.1 hypothetical protein [Tsukamurella ocularis]MCS3789935.1 hypothetical protein [Tsukamurella ocularis]MCS3852432.1 hypothetical protein [Tsukamurella ocularis]
MPDILQPCPVQGLITDLEMQRQYISELMRWHFSESTGSPFWLSKRDSLGFDPIADVHTFSDLTQFPNIVDELRGVAVEDLVPAGLRDADVAAVLESGGTTGAPKRFLMFEEWFGAYFGWAGMRSPSGLAGSGANLLATTPTGPHMIGEVTVRQAKSMGGRRFTIDIDPRWVKKLLANGEKAQADAYVEHLVDQTADILESQTIGAIQTIPVILERLAERPKLVEKIREDVKRIAWGGAHMDADTRDFLKTEVFPGIPIVGGYGSTTIMSVAVECGAPRSDGLAQFEPFSPYVFFDIVDELGNVVPVGERGQVRMNHVTKYAFVPNNLERDTAIRAPMSDERLVGSAAVDVRPISEFQGIAVNEGVY